ncbi:hypothetical protein JL721_12728 [Aureococcus anophagefferens]|nr:hypothetical protein JL721_12728 [Aureococcus anophagefferens]
MEPSTQLECSLRLDLSLARVAQLERAARRKLETTGEIRELESDDARRALAEGSLMLTLFEKRVGYFYFRDELQVDEETLSRVLAQHGPVLSQRRDTLQRKGEALREALDLDAALRRLVSSQPTILGLNADALAAKIAWLAARCGVRGGGSATRQVPQLPARKSNLQPDFNAGEVKRWREASSWRSWPPGRRRSPCGRDRLLGNEHQYVERANFFDGIDVRLAPALADVDGDGDLDLVVGSWDGILFYFENVGSAASPSYEAVTGSANPFDGIDVGAWSKPAFADVDGDGDLDLVVGEHDGILFYYENVGGGVLNYFEIVGSATSPSYEAVTGAANPFDGIYVGQYSAAADPTATATRPRVGEDYGVLFYYENVGNAESPSFEARTGTANPFDGIDVGSRSEPALADVDGDGDLDLVVGEKYGAFYYYENVGNAASPTYAARTGSEPRRHRRRCRSKPRSPTPTATATRLVVGEHDGILFYYENVGSATSPSYAARTGSANPFDGIDVSYYSAPAFADLDDDGDLDLVVGEHDGILFYYENVGNATSPSYEAVTGAANPFGGIDVGWFSAPALADLDGDGDLDLVVGQDDGVLNFFANGYCTQGGNACRGSGLCDLTNVIFSEASCQCLGGFDHEVPDVVMQCGECQAGFYGSTCEPCPQGVTKTATRRASRTPAASRERRSRGLRRRTYQGETGQSSCALADAGFFVQADGASEQTACDAGKYSGSGADECVDCEAGTYQDATARRDGPVELRARGRRLLRRGRASEQTACDAGKYSGSGADECVDCEAGTYQDATGQSSCALADAGFFARGRRAGADRGDAGKYSGSGATNCVPRGKLLRPGASECLDCEAGTYQDADGPVELQARGGGSFVASTGASASTPCFAGSYAATASSECATCEVGTYSTEGSDTRTLCPKRVLSDAEGASERGVSGRQVQGRRLGTVLDCAAANSECATCEVGTYSTEGSDTCTLCPSGYSSDAEGARSARRSPVGK